MTGFGQKSWNIYRQGVGYVLSEWCSLIADLQLQARVPLGYFAQHCTKSAALSYLILSAFRSSVGITAARSSVLPKYKYVCDLMIDLYPHKWAINPEVTIGEKVVSLQGIDVSEGQAIFVEASYSFFVNGTPFAETLDRCTVPNKYFYCLDYFLEALGWKRVFEFPIICDLALQTYWDDPVTTEEQWQDSHPAWRFVKMVEFLRNNAITITENNFKEEYKAYCNAILAGCRYESLEETLAKASTFYKRDELMQTETRMLEALKFRMDHLYCGGAPFFDIDTWKQMQEFKPVTVQRGDGLEVNVDERERKDLQANAVADGFMLEALGEIHFQALATQLLGLRHNDCISEQFCCGYRYYSLERACHSQSQGLCDGVLKSCGKVPAETSVGADGNFAGGCFFEMLLWSYGLSISQIAVDFSHKVPTLEKLSAAVKEKGAVK